MKKFQFSLDTVLGYKQQVLDNLQNEYAALVARVHRQEEHLRQTRESYHACNRELREAELVGITVAEAIRLENGLRFWEQEIERSQQLLRQYQKEAEAKREQVVEARQDTASLEKLKEKKHQDYTYQLQKAEEQVIEELVATKRAMAEESA